MKIIRKLFFSGIFLGLGLPLSAINPSTHTGMEGRAFREEKEEQQSATNFMPSWFTRKTAVYAAATALAVATGFYFGKNLRGIGHHNYDSFGAYLKSNKGHFISGIACFGITSYLLEDLWTWWSEKALKTELLDLHKKVNGDAKTESLPEWLKALDAFLTIISESDAYVNSLTWKQLLFQDAGTWRGTFLKKAIKNQSPQFLLEDTEFLALMNKPQFQVVLVRIIGTAERQRVIHLVDKLFRAHMDDERITKVIDADFLQAAIVNPDVLLNEPMNSLLTDEERKAVQDASDAQMTWAASMSRFV